jgi:hypothetical protein
MIYVREEALTRLGITEKQLSDAPKITPQIRMIVRTVRGAPRKDKLGGPRQPPYGPGGNLYTSWPTYLEASDVAEAGQVRDVYYSLPRYLRVRLPIEAFCVAAGVSPLKILEILTLVLVRQGTQASQIVAAVNHPRVVAKTVEMAMTDEGYADRVVLHKHANFLPTPQGPRTSVVVTQNATATAAAQAIPAPPPEQTIRRLADRFNLARELPAQVTTPIPAMPDVREAELVEVEAETDDDVRED